MRRPTLSTLAAMWIGVSIAGGGYHQGTAPSAEGQAMADGAGSAEAKQGGGGDYHWSSIYRPEIQTVAVPIFKNNDYQRGVEFALTKALVNQIEANTPYKV